MSATGTLPSASSPTLTARLRTARAPVVLVALVLVVLALLAWAGGQRATGSLDPNAVDPGGSRALARLLEGQGVTVVRAATATEAASALTAAPGATLLVTVPELVSPRMAAALRGARPAHVVTIGAVPAADGPWPASVATNGTLPVAERDPGCAWPVAQRAGSATVGGRIFTPEGATSCYEGTVVDVPGTGATLLGSGAFLTNGRLAEAGNAALALGVLGRDPVLVWWLPSLADPLQPESGHRADPSELVPSWVPWALLQVGVAVLVLAYARGRRFGPVVSEPLPVTVRAAETTEGLGRMYRRAQGRAHAADRLARAAVVRLAPALSLPRGAPAPDVARAAARRTGRPEAEIRALLDRPAPADDAALVRFVRDLDDLERQVRHP